MKAMILFLGLFSVSAQAQYGCYREIECQVLEKPCELTSRVINKLRARFVWRESYHIICPVRNGGFQRSESFLSSPYTAEFTGLNVMEIMQDCQDNSNSLVLCK